MKILLVNTYDRKGGAATATSRLFGALKKRNINLKLLVQTKTVKDPDILRTDPLLLKPVAALRPYFDFIGPFLRIRRRILFSVSNINNFTVRKINTLNPDIVHLNWITGGFIRIESLEKINSPIVWTLHDLWAFTGGCHNPLNCERYKFRCGKCPLLRSISENDLSRKIFLRKEKTYEKLTQLTIITPSRWLSDCVKSGSLLSRFRIEVVPNGLDTSVFKPCDKHLLRQKLNLPLNRRIILFGGIRAVQYKLKGFNHLIEALGKITDLDFELVVFGSKHAKHHESLGLPVRFLGFIAEEEKLAAYYAAADVTVVPSFQEVFGQTASESLACGCPVVAYATTGLLDIILHKENGYLARAFDPDDLAAGIRWILSDPERHDLLSQNAREHAVKVFDIQKISAKISDIYNSVITR